jgi:hypothetical protein
MGHSINTTSHVTTGYLECDPCGLILIAGASMDSRSTQPLMPTTMNSDGGCFNELLINKTSHAHYWTFGTWPKWSNTDSGWLKVS